MREILNKRGNYRYYHKRREHNAESGEYPTEHACLLLTDKGGCVNGDNAGRALADGVPVHDLFIRCPAALFDDLALKRRQHRIAEGRYSDHGEGYKQPAELLKFIFHFLRLSAYSEYFAILASHSALSAPLQSI